MMMMMTMILVRCTSCLELEQSATDAATDVKY